MRVAQIVAGIDGESSGPAYSVPALCSGLCRAGADVELLVPGRVPPREYDFSVRGFPRDDWPGIGVGRASGMGVYLKEHAREFDVVHSNGLWLMSNIYPYWATRGTSVKFVSEPRGTLSAWAMQRSKWKKWVFGHAFQYAAMRATDMWVATAEHEYEDIRRLGYRQPIAMSSNGVDVPISIVPKDQKRHLVFLSRIHPVKGVDFLLRAWRTVQDEFPEWDLRIAGPIDEYARRMISLSDSLGCARCTFVGEIRSAKKLSFYGESECLVLPTHSENFGMVVAEALASGTAAICTKGAPWEGLAANGCGAWIDIGVDPLTATLREFLAKPRAEMVEMGKRGREWVQRDYSWTKIGRDLLSAYQWLCHGGDRPSCVRID